MPLALFCTVYRLGARATVISRCIDGCRYAQDAIHDVQTSFASFRAIDSGATAYLLGKPKLPANEMNV